MNELQKETIPRNLDAEEAVLGSIMVRNEVIADLADILKPDDFYREVHASIYDAQLSLFEKNISIDLVSLSDALRKKGVLEKIGGTDYLAGLIEYVMTSAGSEYHAGLIRESSIRRRLMGHCQDVFAKCTKPAEDIGGVLYYAEDGVFNIADKRTRNGLEPIWKILKGSYSVFEKCLNGQISGLQTGFIDLDRMTSGLQQGDLIILAARPSVGKTALALNVLANLAKAGQGVAFFSLEMSKDQLGLRLMAAEGRVDVFAMRSGRLNDRDHAKMVSIVNQLKDLPIFIDDSASVSVFEIKSKLRRVMRQSPLSLVIIDYLQLLRGSGGTETREREVAEICRQLKGLAKEFNVPVMTLSQLNRQLESRTNKRPQLSDLRESGAIEQDADVVAFLYRSEVYKRTLENRGKTEVILAKQRNGPTGEFILTFLDRFSRFENFLSTGDENELGAQA